MTIVPGQDQQSSDSGASLPEPSESRLAVGREMHGLIADLYPICRSITGEGVRETLRRLQTRVPLTLHEVPTGTRVFDWIVPPEWNIRDAYVKNAAGERVIDFRHSNLHVIGYSVPVAARMSLAELRPRLISLPAQPDAIPYRTAYYNETWGFCVSHEQLLRLAEGEYEVRIDSSLKAGSLTYGEVYLAGETADEVLISSHVCHPSLCNDNLSGLALAVSLARHLSGSRRRHSFRFLFAPGTIGSITWLARNRDSVYLIKHGLVLANVGDGGAVTYKKSRRGDAEIDRAVGHVLRHSGQPHGIRDFIPYGYDERQFCSPGFDLPVGCFSRTSHGEFPEYHTSKDNLDFMRPDSLADSYARCLEVIQLLEGNRTYVNQNPMCEPQLGRRGLYGGFGGSREGREREMALLWVLNLSDGRHSLLDVAERAGLRFDVVRRAADALLEHGLLKEGGGGAMSKRPRISGRR